MSKIIILNGGSCSGKSTIAKEICRQSGDKFVHLQIDETKKYLFTILDRQSTPREIGRPICDEILLNTSRIFLENGKNVLIDTIFDGVEALEIAERHINFFTEEKILLFGIHCSLEIKLKRFEEFNNNPVRNRETIIAQHDIHNVCKNLYDEIFDTQKLSASEIAEIILQKSSQNP